MFKWAAASSPTRTPSRNTARRSTRRAGSSPRWPHDPAERQLRLVRLQPGAIRGRAGGTPRGPTTRRHDVRRDRGAAPVAHHHLTRPVHAGRGGDLDRGRPALRARHADPGRVPRPSVHRDRLRRRHRARRTPDARQGVAHPPRRAWPVRGAPQPVSRRALSLARDLADEPAARAPRHGQRRRRGDHGGSARAPPRDRTPVPSRVRPHRLRLRAARPLPARDGDAARRPARPRRRCPNRRRHGRHVPGGAGPLIIESILTTMDARGAVNFAPMGVEWGDEEIVIKPFLETTTFRNLEATHVAVVNLSDDVMLFAQGAIGNVQFPAIPAQAVRGVVLEAACSWREVEVRSLDATPPRARVVTRVVHRGVRREFLGFNRARHAVLEAAILATRIHLLPPEQIRDDFARLQVIVDKTAGPREREAMALLTDYVRRAPRPV